MKILGAAAAEKYPFQRCLAIGRALNDHTVSIGSALDHCHVPGRQHQSIPEDVCVVGAGIHNEPGQQLISPFPSVEDLIARCLRLLCDPTDPERAFATFEPGDSVTLLVNNYGGLSVLELGALTDEVQQQLAATWKINPVRTLSGTFETSLNAPGFSVSLCNISAAARQADASVDEFLTLFDRQTTAVSWPNVTRPSPTAKRTVDVKAAQEKAAAGAAGESTGDDLVVDAALLEKGIRTACERAIAAEPDLTRWDMVMGDGDCGEAVKGLAESVQRGLDGGIAKGGSVFGFLASLIEAADDMGGTLGAILGILLSAFSASLRKGVREATTAGRLPSPELYAKALALAAEALKSHTSAREGDRTVMDVLLPFADEFAKTSSLTAGVKVAAAKAEATRFLKARFGRATYVGEAEGQELPDPGAWALYEILRGLAEGLGVQVDL
jgi:triose/dihydroxyacetone kinase / FAD-AMP lyase (cyclizing)